MELRHIIVALAGPLLLAIGVAWWWALSGLTRKEKIADALHRYKQGVDQATRDTIIDLSRVREEYRVMAIGVVGKRRFSMALTVAGALAVGFTIAQGTAKPIPPPTTRSQAATFVRPSTTRAVAPSTATTDAPTDGTLPTMPTGTTAPPTTAPRPSTIALRMPDFTTACRQQYGDPTAIAKITRNRREPPSYWVKCFAQGANAAPLSLDDYCATIKPGTRSANPKRYDYTVAHRAWLSWQCVQE